MRAEKVSWQRERKKDLLLGDELALSAGVGLLIVDRLTAATDGGEGGCMKNFRVELGRDVGA